MARADDEKILFILRKKVQMNITSTNIFKGRAKLWTYKASNLLSWKALSSINQQIELIKTDCKQGL